MGKWRHRAEGSYLLIRSSMSNFGPQATNRATQGLVTPKYRATSNLVNLGIGIKFYR
jgi:hypothetical protein